MDDEFDGVVVVIVVNVHFVYHVFDEEKSPATGRLGSGQLGFQIGSRRMKLLYTPHVPHGWDCGILFDQSPQTLLCGDLLTFALHSVLLPKYRINP